MMLVDIHAHVFPAHTAVAGSRYQPDYAATVEQYLAQLDAHGLDGGVLIQPSFLGTDNSVMLDAVAAAPDRLKAIAVLSETTPLSELQQLKARGVAGIRLNLFGRPLPDVQSETWQAFFRYIEQLGWQIELHAPPAYLRELLPALAPFSGMPVVLDHFGRPDVQKGTADPDYQQVLTLLNPARHWVKISGFYRLGASLAAGLDVGKSLMPLLLDKGLAPRLLWGSDWLHTQYEAVMSYASAFDAFATLLPDEAVRRQILADNPAQLFGF